MLQKPRSSPSSSSSGLGCKIVSWVGSGIYTAFFVSLDRCSCVKLDTIDIYEPVKEQPLLFHSHRRSLSVNSSIALTSSQHRAFSRRRPHSKARHNSSSACKSTRRKQDNDEEEEEEEEEENDEEEDGNNEEEEEVLSIRPR